MGNNLSQLLLGAEFEQNQLFAALLDVGGSVDELYNLSRASKTCAAWVTATVSALSPPLFVRLLLAAPMPPRPPQILAPVRGSRLRVNDLVWEVVTEVGIQGMIVRLIQLGFAPEYDLQLQRMTWGHYKAYGTVIAVVCNVPAKDISSSYNCFFPSFEPGRLRWYPFLDAALVATSHRIHAANASVASPLVQARDVMQRERSRLVLDTEALDKTESAEPARKRARF